MNDLLQKLQPIFQDIFEDDDLVISRLTNSQEIEEWDSLAHINLVTSIEQEFDIRFALGELEDLQDVGEMIDLMSQKIS
jgi:acyl carrier protein